MLSSLDRAPGHPQSVDDTLASLTSRLSLSNGGAHASAAAANTPGGLAGVANTSALVTPKKEPGLPRLVISKMVLRNFKSYAGAITIGPFHKSFTAIVGPNGSGKSNVIDALLFVFGFKAKKMRQGKLSDLIHHSAAFPKLDSCGVEVHFEEIIDIDDSDRFDVVPGSQLIVSRTVEKGKTEKSTYRINSKTSSFTEVTDLLKAKGVDLDHKRFLILQGEVESIALMKPKAQTEHEDGLLEYLEDIIGTSKYIEQLEETNKRLNEVNEERDEKLTRLKIVEKDKRSLEPKKLQAEEFINMENELARKKNALYQIELMDRRKEIDTATTDINEAKAQLQKERETYEVMAKDVKHLDKAYSTLQKEYNAILSKAETTKKEIDNIDKKDVELKEKEKHLTQKQKKVAKALSQEKLARSEHQSWLQHFDSDVATSEKELATLNDRLKKEEKTLAEISESLKGKTEGFQRSIEVKQGELSPWLEKINLCTSTINVSQSELDMLKEKENAVQNEITEAEQRLKEFGKFYSEKAEELESLQIQHSELTESCTENGKLYEKLSREEELVHKELSAARGKCSEAKMMLQNAQSRGKVLTALLREKQSGRIKGICGRLGDLGIIDDKFDVAITTACGALESIVVETVESAQRCIEFLKNNNIGRATFLCLDKVREHPGMAPIQTPDGVPRLFDLVQPSEPRFAPVFYQVLSDTLVAQDLQQANRIAFGKTRRFRVVTVTGQMIETSGTMSGGGTKPQKGGMKSKFSAAAVAGISPEAVANLETVEADWEMKLQAIVNRKNTVQGRLIDSKERLPQIQFQLSKVEMEIKSLEKQIAGTKDQIKTLKKKPVEINEEDRRRMKELSSVIAKNQKALADYQTSSSKIEAQIKDLQDKILQAGGVKLRSQKATVDGINDQIKAANEAITKLQVERNSREKNITKAAKSIEKKEVELAEIETELASVCQELESHSDTVETLRAKLKEINMDLEEKDEKVQEMKKEIDEKSGFVTRFKEAEMELKGKIDKLERSLVSCQKTISQVTGWLGSLKLQATGFETDEVEPLQSYSEEALDNMEPAILERDIKAIQDKLSKMTPNLNVLIEYRQKMEVFMQRAKEVDNVTQKRDALKNTYEDLRKRRLNEFMTGFTTISQKLKEMYQMITMGGNAELELVDTMDPFSEGIIFSVMPPKKSWKNISNLSGGEKTLSSLALVFALHHYKPTPLYVMDEIDAALDFRNVSIVGSYIKERTKNGQFIIISLRNNMFELADRLVGIYKSDKAEALRLLLHVANAGRKYKEFLCESYGVRAVADCLARSRSEVTQDYAQNLLYQLGLGNPKFLLQVYKALLALLTTSSVAPTSQQMSGQALRMLLPSIQNIHLSIVEIAIGLLKSPHIQVQYEGYEILRDLISRPSLQETILTQLISLLKIQADDALDEINEERRRRAQKGSEGKTLTANQWGGMLMLDDKPTDMMLGAYIQQSYAAKLLGVFAASSPELAEKMIQLQCVSGLLNTIANTAHPESQRYAANTMLYLVQNFNSVAEALQDHMGKNFFDLLEGKPDTFYRELTLEQVRYLKKNTVKINASTDREGTGSDDESGGSVSSDEDGGSKPSSRGTTSRERPTRLSTVMNAFPANNRGDEGREATDTVVSDDQPTPTKVDDIKAKKEALLNEYEQMAEPNEQELVHELYIPFGHNTSNITFSSNKFKKGTQTESTEKFTVELDQFRAGNQKRIQRDKEEFQVQFDETLSAKLHSIKHDPNIFTKQRSMAVDSSELARGSFRPTMPPTQPSGTPLIENMPLPPIPRDDEANSEPKGNVDEVDGDGNTALHIAAMTSDLAAIQILLESGANRNIVNHSGKSLLEQAAGISDKETSERFVDQLQYWQDENERQSATISYLKIRLNMMENGARQQEEYYRKAISDLQKQHKEHLQAIFKRNEETEKSFQLLQKVHNDEVAELAKLRYEIANYRGKPVNAPQPNESEIYSLRKELAEVMTQKINLEEQLKLSEKLRSMAEKEVNEFRNDINKMRRAMQEEVISQMQEVRLEQDKKEETDGSIVYIKGEGGVKRLKAATPGKLVERLLDPTVYDNQFLQTFLLSFKSFMSSQKLMDAILSEVRRRLSNDMRKEDIVQVQPFMLRIVNILQYWMESYWSDFTEDSRLLADVNTIMDTIQDANLNGMLQGVITQKLQHPDTIPTIDTSVATVPKPIVPKSLAKRYSADFGSTATLRYSPEPIRSQGWASSFTKSKQSDGEIKLRFGELDPVEIARQLTLIEFELFASMKPREFLDLAWMKDDKETRAPNITKMIQWSNHVVNWIVSEIVSIRDNVKTRAQTLEKVILVAQNLEKLNNLNGVKEIMAALQSSSVYRLKKTKETIGAKFLRIQDDLNKLTSNELNYKNLRGRVHNSDPPLIPFPGIYHGDLVFLDTCNKNFLEGGLVNYLKYQKIAAFVFEIQLRLSQSPAIKYHNYYYTEEVAQKI
ncbi:hypothetical protein HDV05_001263 [Chytridiales sp. JEL 0842]|nr:hypothetical protein HDV05_001263 [Chytridiales sp. JEL 0842]